MSYRRRDSEVEPTAVIDRTADEAVIERITEADRRRARRVADHVRQSSAMPPINAAGTDTQRFELKYQLALPQYYRLRAALRPFVRHDEFSAGQRDNRYCVRSLYYDTCDYQAYVEKVTGIANRIKLRVRSYWRERADAAFLKIELKTRVGPLVDKFTERVSVPDYERLIVGRAWFDKAGPVTDEARRLMLLKDWRPKVLVDYQREAFRPLDGGDVRITFDHAQRYAAATELFPRRAFFHTASPQCVVLEIKSALSRPRWLERLAEKFALSSAPNSKYARGIEQTQDALFF